MDPVLLQVIAPLVGTLLTALLKALLPQIPKMLLPVLSTAAGAMSATFGGADVTSALAIGGSSVALREVVDQTRKAVTTPMTSLGGVLVLILSASMACAPLVNKDPTTGVVTVDPLLSAALQGTASSTAAISCKQAPAGDKAALRLYLEQLLAGLNADPAQTLADLATRPAATSPQDLIPYGFAWVWSALNSTLTNPKVQDPALWNALELPVAKAAITGCLAGLGAPGGAA